MKNLPYFCRGEVVRGFGRGSKELGILTANFTDSVVELLPGDISTGIYYGWACVDTGDIHKMVMSIGWNPYYKNAKKSMVTMVDRGRTMIPSTTLLLKLSSLVLNTHTCVNERITDMVSAGPFVAGLKCSGNVFGGSVHLHGKEELCN
uniref:riboflavin kinase n=1 Tax=Hucho hucho TaxID=62062 RepID=A0A4W5KWP2_9TELE